MQRPRLPKSVGLFTALRRAGRGFALAGLVLGGVSFSSAHAFAMPPDLRSLAERHFPEPPSFRATDRFLVLHDTPGRSADNALRLLSLTHHTFYAAMRKAGFHPEPLNKRLVCLMFADKQTFVHYGERADDRNMAWSGGYYSARTNRVALYERPAYRWAEVVADPEQDRPAPRLSPSDANHPLGTDADIAASLARTTHEAAHQLAFNSGVQRRGVMYPFWVSEGLATSFEINARQGLGPGAANPRRQRDLTQAAASGRLVSLTRFIAMTRIDTGNQRLVSRTYAQAWGLFRFLLIHRPNDLNRYMKSLRQAPFGPRSESALRRNFRDAFGSIPEVEADWRRWVDTLPQ